MAAALLTIAQEGTLVDDELPVGGHCVRRYARQLAEPYVLGKWQALKKGVQLECDLARDVERELTLDAVLPKRTQRLQDVSGCGCRPPFSVGRSLAWPGLRSRMHQPWCGRHALGAADTRQP